MKVAIYARYSSDNQRDASIADQVRVCHGSFVGGSRCLNNQTITPAAVMS